MEVSYHKCASDKPISTAGGRQCGPKALSVPNTNTMMNQGSGESKSGSISQDGPNKVAGVCIQYIH